MTTVAAPRPRRIFKGFMGFLRGPAIFGSIILCIYLAYLAIRVGAALELEGTGGGLMLFLFLVGFLGGIFCAVFTIGALSDDEPQIAWIPSVIYAGVLWGIIGIFFLIAGTTFPVQGEHPWVTRDGQAYTVGEEAPRGFLHRNGVPFAQTQEVTREVRWSDVAQNTGQEIQFTTIVTILSSVDPESPALEARFRELLAQDGSLQTINTRLWEAYAPPVLTNPQILEDAVRAQSLTENTVFETNTPWIASAVVSNIEHRVSFDDTTSKEATPSEATTP